MKIYEDVIAKCKSAIWNGPMGVFEMPCYSKGTFAVAKAMGNGTQKNGLLSIIGGGDSASAAELSGEAKNMSHVSTGGGASLELLEGKALPGVTILTNKDAKASAAAGGDACPCGAGCRCGNRHGAHDSFRGVRLVVQILKLLAAVLIGVFIGRRMSHKLVK